MPAYISYINPPEAYYGPVDVWERVIAGSTAAYLPVEKVQHMKNFQKSKVFHEFLILTVRLPSGQLAATQRIIAERQISDKPDQVIFGPWDAATSKAPHRSADSLATLQFDRTRLPKLYEVVSILTDLSTVRPEYHWYSGNCYWYAGSAYLRIQKRFVGSEIRGAYFDKRGYFAGTRIGSAYDTGASRKGNQVPARSDDYDDAIFRDEDPGSAAFQEGLPFEEQNNRDLHRWFRKLEDPAGGAYYIQDIRVEYRDNRDDPDNCIKDISNIGRPDVNAGFLGKYVYLIPVRTDTAAAAGTYIQIRITDIPDPNGSDVANGAGGKYRYVRVIHDVSDNSKITKVALYRKPSSAGPVTLSEAVAVGFNRVSSDINSGRGGSYLHLVYQVTN